jgi:hypothetical protein
LTILFQYFAKWLALLVCFHFFMFLLFFNWLIGCISWLFLYLSSLYYPFCCILILYFVFALILFTIVIAPSPKTFFHFIKLIASFSFKLWVRFASKLLVLIIWMCYVTAILFDVIALIFRPLFIIVSESQVFYFISCSIQFVFIIGRSDL